MTPLERAARALASRRHTVQVFDCERPDEIATEPTEWEHLSPEQRARATDDARAVLQAIREPSDGMMGDGALTIFNTREKDNFGTVAQAERAWQAMIDAALEEG